MEADSPNHSKKKRIGDYELYGVLGVGTYATVHRARHISGLEYAIKCIDKSQIERDHMAKQLKKEIAIMRMIKHPKM